MLADSLQKQEGRDARGRFEKGRSGNSDGRYKKGESGNPKGRQPGSRNKATQIAEFLLDGEAEALTPRPSSSPSPAMRRRSGSVSNA